MDHASVDKWMADQGDGGSLKAWTDRGDIDQGGAVVGWIGG